MSKQPTRQDILDFVAENPGKANKRDIARAFGIKGAARIDLKATLRSLEAEGLLEKRAKRFREPGALPPVTVAEALAPDTDGDLFLKPMEWDGEGDAPLLLFHPKRGDPAIGTGDRLLVRLTKTVGEDHGYDARLIRRIGSARDDKRKLLGVFRKGAEGGRIVPIEKAQSTEWAVPEANRFGAKDGELVEAEQAGPKSRMGLPRARIVARLGDPSSPRAVSLIAMTTFAAFHLLGSALSDRIDGRWREVWHWIKSVEYAGWFIAYAATVPYTGYLLTTVTFAVLLALRVGYRSAKMIGAAVISSFIVVLLFKTLLKVNLPAGQIYEALPDGLRQIMLTYF